MAPLSSLTPSSATTGFFQPLPVLYPQYSALSLNSDASHSNTNSSNEDFLLSRIIALYLPSPLPPQIAHSLDDLARKSLHPTTLQHCVDAEVHTPKLNPLGTFGQENRSDALWTGEGWRALKGIGIEGGIVAWGYGREGKGVWNRRVHQFAAMHLFSGSSAMVVCPAAMTDGAAVLLGRHLDDADGDQKGRAKVLAAARERLVSFDAGFAWTSGQWMTERTGGSDISLTESVATRLSDAQMEEDNKTIGHEADAVGMPLGPWRIDGFKWFSSATDADMVVLLARTERGISAFYAPMRRMAGGKTVMNGVRIIRLKDKMGTKPLPTAELEIKGMRAWLVGEEGGGVKEISSVLNVTRLWTAIGAISGLARGLAIAKAYSRVRKVKNALLEDNPQHLAWMADEVVKYRAAGHLAFFGTALQGMIDQGVTVAKGTAAEHILPTTKAQARILLRVLTPVMKAQCSLASVAGLRACMESLGGVGYCENHHDGGIMNVARLFRDANVNCIWEGTTSVMAEDLVRALKDKSTASTLDTQVRHMIQSCADVFEPECHAVEQKWSATAALIAGTGRDKLLYQGREILRDLEVILCACLLMYDARCDRDQVSAEIARRWISGASIFKKTSVWKQQMAMDRAIFIGGVQDETQRQSRL